MSKWKNVIIGNHINLISGYAFKSVDFLSKKTDGTLPVIKIKNVANGDVNLKDVVYHKTNSSLEKYILSKGDVLIAMTGNHPHAQTQVVGDVSRYKLNENALLNQRVGKLVVTDDTDIDFVYYLLKSEEVKYDLANKSSGSANQANISKADILGLNVLMPLPNIQKRIGLTLRALDDKIDLLHYQNATLEKMAETLFRQRFIEKTDDWEVVQLKDLGEIICGKTPSKKIKEYFNGAIPFIKIPDMHGKTFVFDSEDSLTEEGLNSQPNKTIPPKSICVSCIATVGLVVMNAKKSQTNQQINSIIPAKETYRYFIYLKMLTMKDELLAMASGGTATDNLNTGDFSKIDIKRPPESKLIDFHENVNPMFEKIYSNQTQIHTLTALRDTLLPKLIRGGVVNES